MRVLLYGATGWIGGMFKQLCEEQGVDVRAGRARIESRRDVLLDIEQHQPTHVVSAAGATGAPSIDWCEDHKADTIRSNVIGQLNLADVCHGHNLHLTYFGTGCIYSAVNRATGSAMTPFREEDPPCPPDSFYLTTKAMVDDFMAHYPNVLTLRVRMPMSADMLCPRNLVNKLLKYKKVVSIPNSFTVLPDLLPLSLEMARRGLTGPLNFTNPGAISHNEILALFRAYVDPHIEWENFTVDEQAKVVKAPRSNNVLDTSRIQDHFPNVLPIREALIKHVFEPASKDKDAITQAVRSMRA